MLSKGTIIRQDRKFAGTCRIKAAVGMAVRRQYDVRESSCKNEKQLYQLKHNRQDNIQGDEICEEFNAKIGVCASGATVHNSGFLPCFGFWNGKFLRV